MGRKEIEKNDERLIKQIRDIVSKKEKKKTPVWKARHFQLICLFTGLIVAGLVIFGQQMKTTVSNNPEPDSRQMSKHSPAQTPVPEPAEVPAPEAVREPAAIPTPAVVQAPEPDTVDAPAPEELLNQNSSSENESTASTIIPVEKSTPLISLENEKTEKKEPTQATAMKSRKALLKKGNSVESGPTDPSKKAQVSGRPLNIQIHKIVSCGSVIDRQYVLPKTRFSLKENPTPVVWMKVLSDNPPFTLTHVYYLNDRKYCEVPLSILYPHMRTWSSVTLKHPDHEGEWRVEVITGSGIKLDQIEFTVVE